jgi:cytochrome c556
MSKFVTAGVVSLLLLTSGAASAADADERAQAAAETRQGLLKVVVSYFGPILGMVRQQIPYDGEVVQSNASNIATLLPMIPHVFKSDTSAFDLETEALDNIWQDFDEFSAKAAASAQAAADLAAAAEQDQGAAVKAFGALGASCKACHDDYRQQN